MHAGLQPHVPVAQATFAENTNRPKRLCPPVPKGSLRGRMNGAARCCAESLELCGSVVMTCSAGFFFSFLPPLGLGKPYAGPFRPAIKSFSLSEDFLSPVAFSINSSQTDKSLPIGPAALYRSSYSPQVRRYLARR